ncbi:MAG: PorT family protein [Gemmatimonadetes bacterium]|nr:PorT family protein [Gemmatimonadota bacterium]
MRRGTLMRKPMLGKGLLSLLIVLGALPAAAAGLQWGAQGGVNLARVAYGIPGILDPGDVEDRFLTGARGGVVLSLASAGCSPITVETGLSLERRGGETALPVRTEFSTESTLMVAATYRMTCLTVPVAAKARLGSGAVRPYAKAGGEVVFPLSAELEDRLSPGNRVIDIKDDVKTLNFGLLGALGVEFPLASVTGTAEVSYHHGIGDFRDVSGADADAQLRHRVVGFALGVLF